MLRQNEDKMGSFSYGTFKNDENSTVKLELLVRFSEDLSPREENENKKMNPQNFPKIDEREAKLKFKRIFLLIKIRFSRNFFKWNLKIFSKFLKIFPIHFCFFF